RGRTAVVWVAYGAQPRLGSCSRKDILDVLGHATRAREEVGRRGLAAVEHDLAGSGGNGRVRLRSFGRYAHVNLRARVRVDVELPPARVRGQRVGAARDRLRL